MTTNKHNCFTSQYELLQDGKWVLAIETFYPVTLEAYDKAKERVESNKRNFGSVDHMRNFEIGQGYHPNYK